MKVKIDTRGRKTIVDPDFIEEFFDFYASVEPHFRPLEVPTRVLTVWAKPRMVEAGLMKGDEQDSQVLYRLLRQFLPDKKRFNAKKYGALLDAYREKYKRIAVFETRENLNLVGQLLRHMAEKLLKDENMTFADLEKVAKIHLETARHIQSEEREDRQEKLEVAKGDKSVSEKEIEESARLLNLLSSK